MGHHGPCVAVSNRNPPGRDFLESSRRRMTPPPCMHATASCWLASDPIPPSIVVATKDPDLLFSPFDRSPPPPHKTGGSAASWVVLSGEWLKRSVWADYCNEDEEGKPTPMLLANPVLLPRAARPLATRGTAPSQLAALTHAWAFPLSVCTQDSGSGPQRARSTGPTPMPAPARGRAAAGRGACA